MTATIPVRRWTGAAVVLAAAGITLSTGFIWAADGLPVHAFIATVATWSCYLAAHYLATGRFMDSASTDSAELPASRARLLGVGAGGVVFAAGVAVMAMGVHVADHAVGALGGVLFFAGYAAVHVAVTGDML